MTNPQPHIPTEGPNAGVPLCQEACPHCIAPFDGCVADCKLTEAECILDNPCLPAVRQMAAKLRDVRELAERFYHCEIGDDGSPLVERADELLLAILDREETT